MSIIRHDNLWERMEWISTNLGDFTSSLTAQLIVASLSKKLNNVVKSTKTKLTEHSEETEERGL